MTGDLDAHTIAALGAAPVDSYGVGANVVTGMGVPTAGFVYKLVAIAEPGAGRDEPQSPVAKRSPGKASFGGRKWAWRALLDDAPSRVEEGAPASAGPVWADIVTATPDCPSPEARALQVRVVETGRAAGQPGLEEVRAFHAQVRDTVGPGRPLLLDRRTR